MQKDKKEKLDGYLAFLTKRGISLDEVKEISDEISQNPNIIEEFKKGRDNLIKLKEIPASIKKRSEKENWYPGPRASDIYWPNHKKYLLDSEKFDLNAIQSIDKASSKILALMDNPYKNVFKTKGLVLGYIQSGKTANFTALITKSADVGYKFFIILAGITNSLRKQTQERFDKDVKKLFKDSWFGLTTMESDSIDPDNNADFILSSQNEKKVYAIVKKNSSVLEKLIEWLMLADPSKLKNCPTLIIDDEADHASINTKTKDSEEDRSRINNLIINLSKIFQKRAYVGYTATPFANILIDPYDFEDLYPSDFIVSLPKSSNYFGPEKIFGRLQISDEDDDIAIDGMDVINYVNPDEIKYLYPKGKNETRHFKPKITQSLKDAICYYWMAAAAINIDENSRILSMLVHSTYLAIPQIDIRDKIIEFKEEVRKGLLLKDQIWKDYLEMLWNKERLRTRIEISFNTVYDNLLSKIIPNTEIIAQNYNSDDIDLIEAYKRNKEGIFIIVGGNILSRGLTLKNLVVSYYIRMVEQYDTLLQMGRWFGYRNNIKSYIRIWTTEDLDDYFTHLAYVEQSLRNEIQKYEETGLTPMDLAIKIPTHPSMKICSHNKRRNAIKTHTSFSGLRIQTFYYRIKDRNWLGQNILSVQHLLQNIHKLGIEVSQQGSHNVFLSVPIRFIIQFFQEYEVDNHSKTFNSKEVTEYLKKYENEHPSWNIVIIGRNDDEYGFFNSGIPNLKCNLLNRTGKKPVNQGIETTFRIKSLVSFEDMFIDLKIMKRMEFNKDYFINHPALEKYSKTHTKVIKYREIEAKNTGLLLIYPISKNAGKKIKISDTEKIFHKNNRVPIDSEDNVIGIGVYFPEISEYEPQSFVQAKL